MTKRKLLLKTVAGISAAAMAFSLVSYAPLDWGNEAPYAYQAYALSAPTGYTTDSNGFMAWKFVNNSDNAKITNNCVDILGAFDNGWKMVCYDNLGFRSVLKIGDNYYYPDLSSGIVYNGSAAETNVGLSVKFAPEYANEGKLLKLVYNVTNTSDAPITFGFGIGSDVQIGSDDYAPITKLDKTKDGVETGFLMTSRYDKDGDGNSAAFGMIANGAKGANASSFWFGKFTLTYEDSYIFEKVPENDLTGTDSGATVSWQNFTVGTGETVSLSAYVGIGSADELSAIIKEMLSASTDYEHEQITDLDPNSKYEITIDGDVHPITSSENGTIPMEGKDDNGNPYSMIGKTSSIVKKGNGETEDSDPVEIEISARPETPNDPNAPTGTPEDIITPSNVVSTGDSIIITAKPDTEYTIDGGKTWIKPDENGDVIFDGLSEGEEIIIQTRTPATDSTPASPISEGVKVTVTKTLPDEELKINADDLVFTGEPQSAEITCDDPDVAITYSTAIDGEFTPDAPTFTEDGVYTVYYCAKKPGYLPKYGSYTVTVVKVYDFDNNEHWKTVDGVKVSVGAHTYGDWKMTTEPDCVNDGVEKRFCTVCGYGEEKIIHANGHDLTKHEKIEATCTDNGTVEYYECGECGKLFADENAETELTEADLVIKAEGHNLKKHEKVESSCVDNGTKEYYTCLVCGKLFADAEGKEEITDTSIPAAGHKISEEWKHSDTLHYHECTVCGEKFDEALHTYGEWKIIVPATADKDGVKARSCDVCGFEQTAPVNYVPNEDGNDTDLGKINNTTDADKNACSGDISITRSEIVEKLGLTDDELTAVENGVDVNVYLVVNDITDSVSDEDKALAEDIVSDDETAAMYLDVSLFKQVSGFEPTQVTSTDGTVKITFKLPEKLANTDSNVTRKYFIIRVHDGKAEKIACDYNSETGVCSFETDKFSSYALCYADTKASEPAKPAKPVYYPISVSGNVTVDRTDAKAGETVNVSTAFGYDIIVRDASGRVIATITEKGSFKMPSSAVYITVVRNETLSLMANGWRHSYVYSYDAAMTGIKVNSDAKRGKVVIDLGADYAGREFTIYSGKKSTSNIVKTGTLDSHGRYVLNTADGKNYTLIVK